MTISRRCVSSIYFDFRQAVLIKLLHSSIPLHFVHEPPILPSRPKSPFAPSRNPLPHPPDRIFFNFYSCCPVPFTALYAPFYHTTLSSIYPSLLSTQNLFTNLRITIHTVSFQLNFRHHLLSSPPPQIYIIHISAFLLPDHRYVLQSFAIIYNCNSALLTARVPWPIHLPSAKANLYEH